jgi:ATP-dependent RNA helicase DDX21
LVMAPTRELAQQVAREFTSIARELVVTCIYGGVAYDEQINALRNGLDIVIGTPGRLIDHVEKGTLRLDQLKFICMDEADQMLDIGFADSMDKILDHVQQQKQHQTPPIEHQTLLFSATLPDWIHKAVQKYMKKDKVTVDLIGNEKYKASELVKHLCIASRWQNR